MTLSRLLPAVVLAALLPVAAAAQNTFSIGLGPQIQPGYFGSSDYETGIGGSFDIQELNIGPLHFGDSNGVDAMGLGFTGSLGFINERNGVKYRELAGTDPIDAAIELGGGITYTAQNYYLFAVARYGVTGHSALVGDIGADAIFRPSDRLELRVGPRLSFADDEFAQQYFGVTAAEAARAKALGSRVGQFTPAAGYDAKGGLLGQGVEASAVYDFTPDWSMKALVRYDRFVNDAEDSPIVRQGKDSMTSAGLVLTRRFSF
ncbi:Outer membrane scaffolding protein for murein synthesis, MipA/OmpV family [Loktanella atrilutea]|uniref:Outer membrane scaffolding protein for murein synthesis, MipA/OmpV family n=1 Tax=Loktanella atrilutea TaxID=366533 RepID=A0A1M5A4L7_LOKAT|nr:MipA/OmpV family protein [Loktanella atrilutea]SHF25164.1 Outer membrane scaffolding protein for murein synthesis, MipA/OmpV family [Loktanella atrilutea]